MLASIAKSVLMKIPARNFRALAGLTIFYMHGLVRSHADARVQRLHLTIDEFTETMRALKAWVRFVSIEEALQLAAQGKTGKPLAVLTSDDGYVDNHDILMPLTAELGIPLALFVSTHHIETGARFPTYLTRCFAYYADEGTYTLPGVDTPITIARDQASRVAASDKLGAAIYRLAQAQVRDLLAAVVKATGPGRQAELDAKFTSDQPMTWRHVKAMHDAGVEIGAHAHEHAILHRHQPLAEVEHQIARSKKLIEQHLGACRYFAYPVGGVNNIGPGATRAVGAAGFAAAFSTIRGTLGASRDPFLHPRVMLHRDARADETMFPFTGLRYDRALPARQASVRAI